jgi:hypothetical protein
VTTPQLDTDDRERLIRLLGMTGSDHDGEVSNAARLADRLVRSKGLRWGDVIPPSLPSPHTHRAISAGADGSVPNASATLLRRLQLALPGRGLASQSHLEAERRL